MKRQNKEELKRQKELNEIEALLGVHRPGANPWKPWYKGHPNEDDIKWELKRWDMQHEAKEDSIWNALKELDKERTGFEDNLKVKYGTADSTNTE